ncbi:dynein heavy chain 6, axonemal [Biomphalaria glabrata]|nr:dynein heavy chain 6, axonemal [Biomphalaria glabrata]
MRNCYADMSSLNESRSSDNVRRPNFVGHVISHADSSFQGNRTLGNVHSSPAAATPELTNHRPNFLSADHVYRLQVLEANDAMQPALNNQKSRAGGNDNAGGQQGGASVYISRSFRQTLQESNNLVMAVAEMEKNKKSAKNEEDLYDLMDSSVDDAKTFPVLPPISRRNSDRLERSAHQGLTIRSLPDLKRIKSTFASIAAWEGVTSPEVIVHILETHPNVDVIYMSPAMQPEAADYSPYFMHMVSPGSVDVMNYCVVGRQFAIRYIKGKKPHRLTLKRWMFEQKVTVKLRQNNFFKNFRILKAFNGLAQNMDMRNFGKTKRRLRSILNLCNPAFADTLLLVQTMCLDLESLSMIQVDKELTYTLNEFMEDQEHYTREITSKIERYTSMLLHLTSRTCWDDAISAGLAVEREERKHLAPKRINELRKMQRKKLSTVSGTSQGMQRHVQDESSIGQWIHVEACEAKQFEKMKEEKCVQLTRFIYSIDCMLRQALFQIYLNSLRKTADYLSIQMKTFPTDSDIKALVKGYVGDLDIQHLFFSSDDDDDDDAKGVTGRPGDAKGDKGDKQEHQNNVPKNGSFLPGKEDKDQPAPHKSQGTMENEVSTATTTGATTFMSSSVPTNFTSDSHGPLTSSTAADNALYIQFIHGELGNDSLDSTTSSSLSDEGDVNAMGNEDRFVAFNDLDLNYQPAHLDDLNTMVVTGTEMRTYRLGTQSTYQPLTNESIPTSTDDFLSEHEEVTIVENANLFESNDGENSVFDLSTPRSNFSSEFNSDVASTDLTITSEDRDSHSRAPNNANVVNTYFISQVMPRVLPISSDRDLMNPQGSITKNPSLKSRPDQKLNLSSKHYSIKSQILMPTVIQKQLHPSEKRSGNTALKDKNRGQPTSKTHNLPDALGILRPHDSNVMGLFGHLFSLAGESSVDLTEDSHIEDMLEFPILDGTAWEPENIDHYLSVRNSHSSSVDQGGHLDVQNIQNASSDTSNSTMTSLKTAENNCGNKTQNKMSSVNNPDPEVKKKTLQPSNPTSDTDTQPLDLRTTTTSGSNTNLALSGEVNILDFLAKEMDYNYSDDNVPRVRSSHSYPSAFVDITDESEESQMTKQNSVTGEDTHFVYSSGIPGARKDGGRRRKKGKARFPDTSSVSSGETESSSHGTISQSTVKFQDAPHSTRNDTGFVNTVASTQLPLTENKLIDKSSKKNLAMSCNIDKLYRSSTVDPNEVNIERRSLTSDTSSTSDVADIDFESHIFLPTSQDYSCSTHDRKIGSKKNLAMSCNIDKLYRSSTVDPNEVNIERRSLTSDTSSTSDVADIDFESHIFLPASQDYSCSTQGQSIGPERIQNISIEKATTFGKSDQEPLDSNNGNVGRSDEDDSSKKGNSLANRARIASRNVSGGGVGSYSSVPGPPTPPQSTPRSWSDGLQDIKPMFHAAVHLEKHVICMTPDVFDFTGAAFNMIHDMEEHLVSIETLTSNCAFLPFVMPSVVPGTPVDKNPKGPSLEIVLRRDHQLVQLKNTIYGCIDAMFHSAGIYTEALQKLLTRYFLPEVELFGEMGARDAMLFLESLQLLDAQLKLLERLPESQRLGMFLFDISPFKESLRVALTVHQQTVQENVNHETIIRIQSLIRKLDNLQALLESHPSTLDALYVRLTTTDSIHDIIHLLQSREITQIANLYNIMDRFAVPYNEDERRVFESCHYMLTSIQRAGEVSRKERNLMIEGIEKCLERDVAWIHSQVKKILKPLTENSLFLDGFADVIKVKQALMYAEEVVRSYVTKANFVREIQRYLGRPESHFSELFQLSARYVNTRNLWLLMADWDTKFNNWKRQSFVTLDIQKINNYTFKYMEACNKLEKVLPKNTVVSVFGEKMDIMLRWLNFIIEFRGQAVKARHWRQIEEVLGVEFGDQLPLTLASLMSINAIEKQKTLHVILNKARAEMNVQSEFDEVKHQCEELKLSIQVKQKLLLEGEEPVTVFLLGDTFEVEEALNYCVMELERIDLSPHSGYLHETLEQFIQQIFESLENIVSWAEMQMKLSRLRRLLLRHTELIQTLPAEVKRYKDIFMEYSHFMESLVPDPSVLKWCTSHEMRDIVEAHHNEIISLYRVFKREIEQHTGSDNAGRDVPIFGL